MLHGSDFDGTKFWGESQNDGVLEAFTLENIPAKCSAVVFTGCCWGALCTFAPANLVQTRQVPSSRTINNSIALSFLNSGAVAFIGCTGSHYSPTVAPYGYFGGPFHKSFWNSYKLGNAPAKALQMAKFEYFNKIPHTKSIDVNICEAIELKILKQFNCLGLGW